MSNDEIPDEVKNDDDVLGRCDEGQSSQPLDECRYEGLRQVTRCQENVGEVEQARFELHVENLRLEHHVKFLIDIRVRHVVLVDENEDSLECEERNLTAEIQRIHQIVGERRWLVQMRHDFLEEQHEKLTLGDVVVRPLNDKVPHFVDVLSQDVWLHLCGFAEEFRGIIGVFGFACDGDHHVEELQEVGNEARAQVRWNQVLHDELPGVEAKVVVDRVVGQSHDDVLHGALGEQHLGEDFVELQNGERLLIEVVFDGCHSFLGQEFHDCDERLLGLRLLFTLQTSQREFERLCVSFAQPQPINAFGRVI